MERGMNDDVERVNRVLEDELHNWAVRGGGGGGDVASYHEWLAPKVLAAIHAAAGWAADWDWSYFTPEEQRGVVDAALAALTDHPGGTENI